MTPLERRVGASLAAIFALRMLGLFLILPVFSVFAPTLPGGDDLFLVGMALGAYGMTQAIFQIPYGIASDKLGRKPVIVTGLLLFAAGSFLAAAAPNIYWVILGRVVQGAGAISAAVTALAADLTRENQRTKAMAMIGASIGLSFAVSLVAAPALYAAIGMAGIFGLTGVLALAAIALLLRNVPTPAAPVVPEPVSLWAVFTDARLARLNYGVFALHAMQTALWLLVPPALVAVAGLPASEHWKVYLPALLVSLVFLMPAIKLAERRGRIRTVFASAIALLFVVQLGLTWAAEGLGSIALWLTLFFVAFNILEAMQPSLTSRLAPGAARGAAMGIYNTTQSVGLAVGGAFGGWLAKTQGPFAVQIFCALLALTWLALAATMAPVDARPHSNPQQPE